MLRQSVRAASVRLPAGLSASSEVGPTRVAMMGDRSLCKARGEVNARQRCSGGQRERRARDFPVQASDTVGFAVTQRRVADSGQLVGECAGGLVVIRAGLHGQRPVPQAIAVLPARTATLAARNTERAPWVSSMRR